MSVIYTLALWEFVKNDLNKCKNSSLSKKSFSCLVLSGRLIMAKFGQSWRNLPRSILHLRWEEIVKKGARKHTINSIFCKIHFEETEQIARHEPLFYGKKGVVNVQVSSSKIQDFQKKKFPLSEKFENYLEFRKKVFDSCSLQWMVN